VAQGTPRNRVYDAILATGATEPRFIEAPPEADDEARAPSVPDEDRVYVLAVPEGAPARGPANAAITIQMVGDFQCPFCARVREVLDQLLQENPDVRLVWRDYPLDFHRHALPAAEAAREVFAQAGNDAFWRYHDLVFDHQQELGVERLVELAREVPGVDAERVRAALEDGRHRSAALTDMRSVDHTGVRLGTPSFFVGGRLVVGAQPIGSFRAALARARADARR
jgi:protein-disulfide isomerase